MTSTGEFFNLEDHEVVLDDPTEVYLRQCSVALSDDSEPSSQMFCEGSNDRGKLSGARSSKTSAQAAYEYRIANPGPGSTRTIGTFGVTVAEIDAAAASCEVTLRVVDDSLLNEPGAAPAHAYLDQRHISEKKSHPDKRRLRVHLFQAAKERRRLWPTPEGSTHEPVQA